MPVSTHPGKKPPDGHGAEPGVAWDITRLRAEQVELRHHYLYVIMDIYSRYVVGWMVADRENSALALAVDLAEVPALQPRVLTLHSDLGAPMTSQSAQLLADLGVTALVEPASGVG